METSTTSFTILVVDDAPVSRTLLRRTLQREHFEVLEASGGREAVCLYEAHHPQMVITDWMMPDLSGLELCKQIRAKASDLYCFLIVVTSLTQKDKVVEALEAGADDYITKPFHPDELLARVRAGRRIVDLQSEVARKSRWLEQLSLTDPLTGIPNRRAAEQWIEREQQIAARYGHSFAVILADLDHFKSVNDNHGHSAGDRVLVQFAKILQANTRATDLTARIGGEEFLLMLPHTDQAGATAVAERIRQQLAEHPFGIGGVEFHVTASFGVSVAPLSSSSFEALRASADAALYEAKRNGRDRVQAATLLVTENLA